MFLLHCFLNKKSFTPLCIYYYHKYKLVLLFILRRNPPDVGVTSGQKSITKIIYIVYLAQNMCGEKRRVFRLLYDVYGFFTP